MRYILTACLALPCSPAASLFADEPATAQAATSQPARRFVIIFDFAGGERGKALAESLRGRLRRHREFDVLDHITTAELSGPLATSTPYEKVAAKLKHIACDVGIYGSVRTDGSATLADVRCVMRAAGGKTEFWSESFTDKSQRWRAVIAIATVEKLRGQDEWVPPQYGDEPEPEKFARAVNRNGDFEDGHVGWDSPDNVATFLRDGPKGRGRVLQVRTDIAREPWLEYRRALRMGRADPTQPPKIARDASMGSVAGFEGVHYRSDHYPAKPGRRYWLLADHNGPGGAKVFIKGFKAWYEQSEGLPESSLAEMGLTPRQFAALSPERRKALIAADVKKNPQRHRRECYRWYLNCASSDSQWKHFAAPFPPRGGLPANVQWLQVQVYSYWPPGEYLWDDVCVYEDPRQKAPAAEVKPRTPNFDKRWKK